MTTYTDSNGVAITLTTKLGEGGEGVVFSTDRGGVVAKILHDRKLRDEPTRRAKIEWMIDHIPGVIHTEKTDTTPRITNISWPTSLVFRNSQFCGYLMPKITRSSELSIIINPSNRARQNLSPNTLDLYRLAHNICTVYRVFHEKNYVIGDINTKNIMVTKNMHISVVDCDSIQVHDVNTNEVYPCRVGVAEYTPPEIAKSKLSEVVRTQNHDGFSIAVLVFQLLMQGYHPFGGIQHPNEPHAENVLSYNMEQRIFPFDQSCQLRCTPPQRAPDYETVIPAQIRELFRQAFLTDVRPTAEVWTTALKSVLETFIPCANDRTHMHPQDSSCTFCSWNSRLSSATTGTLITVQPNAGSKKKKKQPAQVTQSVPPTGNPTNMDGIMWVGSLMFVLSIIALYFLPGDELLSALSYLYEYFTWPLFAAIAILIGVFIQGVRTSDWNLFFGIGLVNFLVVLLYGIIKGLIFLILNHFWPLIGVIAIVILIGAIILGFSTGDWDLFGVIGVVYLLAAVLYGLYYLYIHHFWPLVGVIAIAILIGVIIQKRISTV